MKFCGYWPIARMADFVKSRLGFAKLGLRCGRVESEVALPKPECPRAVGPRSPYPWADANAT